LFGVFVRLRAASVRFAILSFATLWNIALLNSPGDAYSVARTSQAATYIGRLAANPINSFAVVAPANCHQFAGERSGIHIRGVTVMAEISVLSKPTSPEIPMTGHRERPLCRQMQQMRLIAHSSHPHQGGGSNIRYDFSIAI
jgi:hypothetical protein